MSPTEKQGRRHSSFVTVVAYEETKIGDVTVHKGDLEITTFRASGPGGQHRNKTDSGVRLTHLPTNTVVTATNSRSQWENRRLALETLLQRLQEKNRTVAQENLRRLKATMVEFDRTGVTRVATWCEWRDEVTWHVPNRKQSMKSALAGRFKF